MNEKILYMTHWNYVDEFGRNKLHLAAKYGTYHLVEYILDEGVDVNVQDNNGWTALHFAAQNSHFLMIDLLLKNKANPNLCDNQGNSPLWIAAINAAGNYTGVKSLLSNKTDPCHKNYFVCTPMKISKARKNWLVDAFMPYVNENIIHN